MGSGKANSDTSKLTLLYGKLTAGQQADLNKVIVEKLRSIIGGYGELSVLAEYIAVMLQSSRPPEQIQVELEAFLQDQSKPFTDWLCEKLSDMAREKGETREREEPSAGGEALLARAVRDAQARPQGGEGGKKRREKG